VNAPAEELNDQLKIALDMVAEGGRRVLLVLDGCDAVLQNSSIPRNLWDNIRAPAQKSSRTLMTGSRDRLLALCYSPEARGSDFFGIFYPQSLIVRPFDEAAWQEVYSSCGVDLDASARKELMNWTGGQPDLITLLIGRLVETHSGRRAYQRRSEPGCRKFAFSGWSPLEALWRECSEESCGDILQLTRGELLASELPLDRLKFLVERGIATQSGNRVKVTNRFVERLAGERRNDVSGARRLFERPEDFATNIKRLSQNLGSPRSPHANEPVGRK
jgi:hypothetical protein